MQHIYLANFLSTWFKLNHSCFFPFLSGTFQADEGDSPPFVVACHTLVGLGNLAERLGSLEVGLQGSQLVEHLDSLEGNLEEQQHSLQGSYEVLAVGVQGQEVLVLAVEERWWAHHLCHVHPIGSYVGFACMHILTNTSHQR